MPVNTQETKSKVPVGWIIGGSMVGLVIAFGIWYSNRRKNMKTPGQKDFENPIRTLSPPANDLMIYTPPENPPAKAKKPLPKKTTTTTPANPAAASEFPLKKGSKGEKVELMQKALNEKHQASLKVDGEFGDKTKDVLNKEDYPEVVTESVFNVIVRGTNAAITAAERGKMLNDAVKTKDFAKVLGILKELKNTDDYSAANKVFKSKPLTTPGEKTAVPQTIVTGLFNIFTKKEEQEKISRDLLRMGLKFNGKKWSLSGLDSLPVITVAPAMVWVNTHKSVNVPAKMVLGNAVRKELDYTVFENNGRHFMVLSNSVRHT